MTAGAGLVGHLLAASTASAAVALAIPAPRKRLRQAGVPAGGLGLVAEAGMGAGAGIGPAPSGRTAAGPRDEPGDLIERYRWALSLLGGLAPVALVGGVVGAAAGVVMAVVVHRLVGAREPAGVTRRREAVARSLPQVVDLLAVTLASGAAPSRALALVADAVEGPVVDDLRAAEHSLGLGRDPAKVWRDLSRQPGLSALGRTMARAVETGASVSSALSRLAEDLSASTRLDAESKARAVGVRAAVPLGLCLLPAFVLIGIVPLVAGTASALMSR